MSTTEQTSDRLRDILELDGLWRITMGIPRDDKEHVIAVLAKIFADEGVPYAIIGGVAVQLWTEEPRTTKDVDVAVHTYDDVPKEALGAAGFVYTGSFEHSENWRAPGPGPVKRRTAVQFSADRAAMSDAVDRAEVHQISELGITLKFASLLDLVTLKVEAALEPTRRASKRSSDYSDIQRLVEEHPEVEAEVPNLRRSMRKIKKML